MLHTLQTHQLIKSDIKTVWEFMSSPKNLAIITPDYMGFEMINNIDTGKMYTGQIIEYYVKPIMNIKLYWVTEITHVKENEFFIDEQRFGPYAFWHHKHFLKEVPEGIEMYDLVHYKLPFGFIGKMANALFVKKQLKEVFDYRFKKVEEIFNQ
ncbi:MAG: SRPBCC family protein [Bacteroidia bacterium]